MSEPVKGRRRTGCRNRREAAGTLGCRDSGRRPAARRRDAAQQLDGGAPGLVGDQFELPSHRRSAVPAMTVPGGVGAAQDTLRSADRPPAVNAHRSDNRRRLRLRRPTGLHPHAAYDAKPALLVHIPKILLPSCMGWEFDASPARRSLRLLANPPTRTGCRPCRGACSGSRA